MKILVIIASIITLITILGLKSGEGYELFRNTLIMMKGSLRDRQDLLIGFFIPLIIMLILIAAPIFAIYGFLNWSTL